MAEPTTADDFAAITLPFDVVKHNIVRHLKYHWERESFRIACKQFVDLISYSRRVVNYQRILDTPRLDKTVKMFCEIRAHRLKSRESFLGLFQALTVQNCTVTLVDLTNCKLSNSFLPDLVEVLKQCQSLRTLILYQTKLRPQKAVSIADLLRANTPLTELDISGNNLGEAGNQTIADGLQHNTTLRKLHLSGILWDQKDASSLQDILSNNQTLEEIKIAHGLRRDDLVMDRVCRGLQRNSSVKRLKMNDSYLTDSTAQVLHEALCKNTTLEELDLGWIPASALVPHSHHSSALFDVAMSAFKINSTLKKLKFTSDETAMNVSFFNALSFPNCGIRTVSKFRYYYASLEAVSALARSLKVNTTIVKLRVSMEADTLPVLAEALKVNNSVQRVEILLSVMDEIGIDALASALRTNKQIKELKLSQKYHETRPDTVLDFYPLLNCLAGRPVLMELVLFARVMSQHEPTAAGLLELLESRNALKVELHWLESHEQFMDILLTKLIERPHLATMLASVAHLFSKSMKHRLREAWDASGAQHYYRYLLE
eukprot:TRINITY_DN3335_c0_g1_i1.p1 TRINITY_DN3335_c0_g1~~TRINITY_DN3335_c0_g1_i1.p1  ORF type:complete len:565 (+),score=73.91 TRINITY_DN3335_c0_g1_i1:64-1695(+)